MKRRSALLVASVLLLGISHGWCSGSEPQRHDFIREVRNYPLPTTPPSTPRAPVPGDELWWDGFSLPVTDGTVHTAIEYQGSLVIGGRFTRIGETRVNNIARWDGTGWVSIGTGIEWGYVTSLAIHNGELIVGGRFSFAGGTHARSIARWNGLEWNAFGAGLHDPNTNPREVTSTGSLGDVLVAAVDASREYSYGEPAPVPYPYLVQYWTGSTWMDLGAGANGPVRSFATYEGTLFAAGAFDSIGGVPAAGIARWDGTSWSEVGGGLGTWGRSIDALLVYKGRLIAGGGFDTAGGASVSNIASWNGTQWDAMGNLPTQVGAMVVQGDWLFAACVDAALVRWNDVSWEAASPELTGTPADLVSNGVDLFVVGAIEATNPGEGVPAALSVAQLHNGAWHSVMTLADRMRGLTDGGGQQASVHAMVHYRSRLIAAGSFEFCGAPPSWNEVYHLAEWTGTNWEEFPLPYGQDRIHLLVSDGPTLYAVGSFYNPELPSSVYRYDGSNWTPVGNLSGPVWAMTLFKGKLHAAVDDWQTRETRIKRWSGTVWETIGTASGSGYALVGCLAEYDGNLVAAGRFQTMAEVPAANIAVWDGSIWKQFGTGLPSPDYFPEAIVRNLAVHDGHLLVTGDHLQAVQQWTGLTWESLGGLLGSISQLADTGGYLFASGYLYTDDFMQTYSLARWHSNRWEQLGSGTNGPVSAFTALGSSVFMGGWFSEAGGKPSYAIARWDGLSVIPATPALHAPSPNPFASMTSFRYAMPQSGNVRLSVHDVMGREIDVLESGFLPSGTHTITWDGRDRLGKRAASGVYFINASMPNGAHQARKVILLR